MSMISFTNNTTRHGIIEILLKVALNSINPQTQTIGMYSIDVTDIQVYLLPNTAKLFGFQIFWLWAYLMKVNPETCCSHYICCLPFYFVIIDIYCNSNMTSFCRFVKKRAIYRWYNLIRTCDGECDWLFHWQHKLCTTFSANVNIKNHTRTTKWSVIAQIQHGRSIIHNYKFVTIRLVFIYYSNILYTQQ